MKILKYKRYGYYYAPMETYFEIKILLCDRKVTKPRKIYEREINKAEISIAPRFISIIYSVEYVVK